ncbi:hypothetical protein HYH02_006378 [Chlamydomonas schloesseri]|uniref:Peptidase M16 N-terminal domain-containing protein n=1 Tax=Chlamydomonas schloesseri TaxID=2026947 RepID=A0A835WJE8_9CHLO|nr:hypothetical protein HYH02_006378 [Chlamydomonas schloesseri]|eukprot:KAG2448487.1 hypothetical protein HYH02_006378 [Chlamydomonas schloesseri]
MPVATRSRTGANGKAAAPAPVDVLKSPNDKKLYRYMVLDNGLKVLLISDPEMNATPAADEGGTKAMDVDGEPGGAAAAAAAASGRAAGGGRAARAAGRKRARADADDGEESSGDLEPSDGDEDEDEEEEGEEEEGESGEEDESGSGSGDEEMESGSGEDDEGEEEEEEEGEEQEGGGRGGRRRKGGAGSGGGGGDKAPVKKAAAAMAVGVGSFSDPEDIPGLSHYLEHMLFMGSGRYPAENEYDDFLTKHGGSSNAFTDLEITNYHFEVAPPHLAGALDRFAQFFISPLCSPASLEREVLAVDSEFSQVLQDDHCRLSQIMCHTSRPGHVYNKFSWGNRKSLWEVPQAAGLDVRERLLQYYKQHYGADRSCLVVLGGESLEELGRMVGAAFADMPGGRGPAPSFQQLPPPFQGRQLVVMPAVRDSHELRITFQLPPMQRHYGSKSDAYLSHLLGHEGAGSLLSALKARGWATEIMAGIDEDGYATNSCCSLFGVDVTLTEKGLGAGPGGCGLAVAALVFAYINMLRAAGPQEWVWEEMKAMAEMRWRFQEEGDPMDTVSRLAGVLHHTDPAHVLVADYLHDTWDPEQVKQLLGCMDPDPSAPGGGAAFRLDLMTRRYEQVHAGLVTAGLGRGRGAQEAAGAGAQEKAGAQEEAAAVREETEPWFGLQVVVAQLPDSLCAEWALQPPLPELALPPRNPYLPKDFSLRCDDPDVGPEPPVQLPPGVSSLLATPPQLLLDRPGLRLWHKLDRHFRTPRAAVHWRLFSPAGHLLEEGLREDAYLADVAGLHYHTSPEGLAGMEFRVDGFSDKLPVLVRRLAGAFAELGGGSSGSSGNNSGSSGSSGSGQLVEVLAGHFEGVREALVRKYRNMNMEVGKHASYCRLFVLCSRAVHCDDILQALEALTPQDIGPAVAALLAACHVEVFVHGNLRAEAAQQLAADVVAAYGPGCTLAAEERQRDQCVVVPDAAEAAAAAAAAAAGGEVEAEADKERAASGAAAGPRGGHGAGGKEQQRGAAAGGGVGGGGGADPLDVGSVVRLMAKNTEEKNAAIEVYFQLTAGAGPTQRATLDLIDQILYEPCYDTLRTKQQLGYSVYSGTRLTSGVSGFCIQVVSARHPPAYLDACIEAFLAAMGPRLASLAPAALAEHAAALAAAKLQRDRSLVEEAGRLWEHVSSQKYDFLSRETEVAALGSITAEQVYDMFRTYLLPPSAAAVAAAAADASAGSSGSSGRRKLAVHVKPHGDVPAAGAAAAGAATNGEPMAVDGGKEDKADKGTPGKGASKGGKGKAKEEAAKEKAKGEEGEGEEAVLRLAPDGPALQEPAGLVALRNGLPLHPLLLGTAPAPLLS